MKEQKATGIKDSATSESTAAVEAKSMPEKQKEQNTEQRTAVQEGPGESLPEGNESLVAEGQDGQKQLMLESKRQPHHYVQKPHDGKGDHRRRNVPAHQGQPPQVPLERRLLNELSLADLNIFARRFGIVGAGLMNKDQLVEKIKYAQAHPDQEMEVAGVLEKLPDGFGFLRSAQYDYVSSPDDVYVSPSQIRRFGLRTGDMVTGVIRKPKEGEKYFALLKVKQVNYSEPTEMIDRLQFERLTPQHPNKKFNLEYDPTAISTRIMDLFTPIGKGQRGLIVAPPKVGKTLLLKELAKSVIINHPECHLIILLIDERPKKWLT